jgi:phosphate binding protein
MQGEDQDMIRKHILIGLSVMVIAATLLAACQPAATATTGPQSTQAPAGTAAPAPTDGPVSSVELPEINPADYDGAIIVAGSSTVFPLTERMGEIFEADGFAGDLTIDSIGTGAGFERFCVTGETDISNASRAIRDSEIASCQAIGRDPIEFRVGTDALAIAVSTENDFLDNLTVQEIATIFSTDVTLWSEVNPAWPAEEILRFSPGTDSGTYDYFLEAVMSEVFGDEGETKLLDSANLQLSEDDNILVQGVTGSPYAIGYFGYAYYQENDSVLRILNVDGVEPTEATTEAGDYPLARPLFIYSDAAIMQEKPQVGAFINYYLTYMNDEILDVGYFPASMAAWDTAKQALLDALGASVVVLLPEVDPAEYGGAIIVAGSSTVFPLTERMGEIFEADGFAGELTIDSIGTGAGFERFCETGESDISNASRPIREGEIEACRAIGRQPLEFRVGTDALAIVVSTENEFLTGVTSAELAAIFSSDAVLWSDVNAAWPAEEILRFSPGTDSGTYDYFLEAVMTPAYDDDATEDVDEGETKLLDAGNLQLSEDDNVLVQGVIGSPYAIGYFGYAYYQENAGDLKILTIDTVEPTVASVDAGDYPLARPLFIYSDAAIMAEKPQVAAFINYYLTYMDDEIRDVGYFPANRSATNAARQAWLTAAGGAAQ